jgi:hypothetical protein
MCGWPENEFTAAMTDAEIGSHQADTVRDTLQLRQPQGSASKLENEARQQIEMLLSR